MLGEEGMLISKRGEKEGERHTCPVGGTKWEKNYSSRIGEISILIPKGNTGGSKEGDARGGSSMEAYECKYHSLSLGGVAETIFLFSVDPRSASPPI